MRIQLSVFIENRSGRLAKVTTILGDAGINISAISLADTSDFGILRMIVDDVQKAARLLKDNGFTISLNDVIEVEVIDKPGELGKFLTFVEKAGLNVEYTYAFIHKITKCCVLIFRFDDMDKADKIISPLKTT